VLVNARTTTQRRSGRVVDSAGVCHEQRGREQGKEERARVKEEGRG